MSPLPLAGVDVGFARVKPLAQGRGLAIEVDPPIIGRGPARAELGPDELAELRDLINEELER